MFPSPPPDPTSVLTAPRRIFLANHFSKIVNLVDTKDPIIKAVFDQIRYENIDLLSLTENIYGLVSSFDYVPENGTDYWQTPVETIKYKAGDCEDLSGLMSSLFYLGGLNNNYFVLTYNVNWREYHIANLVYVPQSPTHSDAWLYLDASYPHIVGELPFYANQARVFAFFSVQNPSPNPALATFPQPLQTFLENIVLNKLISLQ